DRPPAAWALGAWQACRRLAACRVCAPVAGGGMAPEMTRLARGSMPWPVRRDGRPAALGSVPVESPLAAGAKLRVTAWPRPAPDGTPWLAIEFTLYPRGGRTTVHKQTS